ncbi:hypothetical protein L1987_20449 [Smallanthus sonchifolius]|uniref:Uncharacterized protein n=1 Tax=Smallanthus sonchifolius TaxID=185202 RepID=A0ACB9ISL3_9ASTR|nr:hypothetical protein L1987_20449 [Smallanthus sonchifolius]
MLFTYEECFVLSPGLSKPPPEKILLTSERKDNLYVLDMNKITPSGSVSCFLSKASVDESALWHRRLSHGNVKTINKLVGGNLLMHMDQFHPTNVMSMGKKSYCLNGVAKRRNRTLIECARSMLADSKLPLTFWAKIPLKQVKSEQAAQMSQVATFMNLIIQIPSIDPPSVADAIDHSATDIEAPVANEVTTSDAVEDTFATTTKDVPEQNHINLD